MVKRGRASHHHRSVVFFVRFFLRMHAHNLCFTFHTYYQVDFTTLSTESLYKYVAYFDLVPAIWPPPQSADDPPPPVALLDSARMASRGPSPRSNASNSQSPSRGRLRRSWMPGGRSRSNSEEVGKKSTMQAWVMTEETASEYNPTFLRNGEKVNTVMPQVTVTDLLILLSRSPNSGTRMVQF